MNAQPVGVLAVLDRRIAMLSGGAENSRRERNRLELVEVRGAMAELIEAARPGCMALHAMRMIMSDKEARDCSGSMCERLREALKAVQGAV